MGDGDPDGAAPYLGVVDDEAGYEILIFAGRPAVLEANAEPLVAGAQRPVPRAVLGRETVAGIFGGKRIAVVEGQSERGRVRLEQDIRNGDLSFQIGTLAGVVRILIAADIVPGPAVERALAYPGNVVRHQIVAQTVAFIGRAIEVAGLGVNGKPHAIADTGGEYARILAVGIEHEHISAIALAPPACAERVLACPGRQSTRRLSH